MKKRLAVLVACGVLAVSLCACKDKKEGAEKQPANSAEVTTQAADGATTQAADGATTQAADGATTQAATTQAATTQAATTQAATTQAATTQAATTEAAKYETPAAMYEGNWHEKVAGRGKMKVTVSGDILVFNVDWADSASEMYTWTFSGKLTEAGTLYFEGGLKASIVYDENGKEEKKIITEDLTGQVYIGEDGTMHWSEDGYGTHEFVRD